MRSPFTSADRLLSPPDARRLGVRPLIPCPDCGLEYANEKSLNDHRHRYHNEFRDRLHDDMKKGRVIRVALYARVSTDQGEQDPEQQLDVLRALASDRKYEVVWVGHDMVTGDSNVWERPAGRILWDMVKARKVDAVMTYDASRLSRQHPVSVFKLLDLLKKNGVWFISATEKHFDFSEENEFREVIIFMTSWMNNWFLKNLRASTKRGKEKSIRQAMAGDLSRKQGRHPKGCGKDFPCPTKAHGPDGKLLRPSTRRTPAKAMVNGEMVTLGRIDAWVPPGAVGHLLLPGNPGSGKSYPLPVTGEPSEPDGNPPPENGGE